MTKYAQPTPRNQKAYPTNVAVAVVSALLAAILIGSLLAGCHDMIPVATEADQRPTHDSMTYARTYDGELIRVYVVTDPDTGAQYVVSDRGGITPRLDGFGRVMGTRDPEATAWE
jgi:hypothetical protein